MNRKYSRLSCALTSDLAAIRSPLVVEGSVTGRVAGRWFQRSLRDRSK
jgi:hypothetical protein